MRKTIAFIVGSFLALSLLLMILLSHNANSYTLSMMAPGTAYSGIRVEFSNPGVLECVNTELENGTLQVKLQSIQKGNTDITVICDHPEPELYFSQTFYDAQVKNSGMIVIGQQFSHWEWLIYSMAVYFLLLFLVFLRRFLFLMRNHRFEYRAMFVHALMLIHLAGTLIFSVLSIALLAMPGIFSAAAVFSLLRQLTMLLLAVSLPVALLFAISVSISNIALMRHEGVRLVNMLGILGGGALVLVILAVLLLTFSHQEWSTNSPVGMTFQITITVSILLGEALLWSVIACALMGLRFRHSYDQDYILILGCSIRKDGTLYPLLRGRVDAAVSFYREQLARTGKAAILVPSGGKGSDEPIAEAEAMRNYLLEQGIPEEHILVENRSTTTFENMLFSKQLIEGQREQPKVLFATTNYHVFRSGMIAAQAGLQAEGIGAKTKWYFWPNAFLREFVGILVRFRKTEAMILGTVILQTALLSTLGGIITRL